MEEQNGQRAIVIGTHDKGEKDVTVNLFSLENGIISVTLKGVKNSNAKLKFAKELFLFGNFFITSKGNIVTNAEVIESFYNISKDLKKFYGASAILQIIKASVMLDQPNPQLFVNALKSLKTLCYENVSHKIVVCKFLICVFELVGLKLSLNKCSNCGGEFFASSYLSLNSGGIVCSSCRGFDAVKIEKSTQTSLRLISNTPYEKLISVKIPNETTEKMLCLLTQNFNQRFNKNLNFLQF
ncbi:MAG: DNA repair protein RecO [Clostridia bacterium]